MRFSLALLLASAVAHADSSVGGGAGDQPLLRFELKSAPGKSETIEATATALVLLAPDGKTLWSRPPPRELAHFVVLRKRAEAYRRDPRARPEALGAPVREVWMRNDAIVVSGMEQLFVLARSDGHTLFHMGLGLAGFGQLSFDRAEVSVNCGSARATDPAAGPSFHIDCGTRMVYLWGPGIAVFDTAPWASAGTMMFPDVVTANGPDRKSYRFTVGGVAISIAPVR